MALTKVPGTLIADSTITSTDILDSTITNAKLAVDPANASNLSSGDVPLAQLDNVPAVNLSPALDDIALLAFKTQANGNLARYNLVDQSVDAFEDASGVDAGTSTNESRNSAGKYYSGVEAVTATGGTITTDGDYTVHKFLLADTGTSFTTDTAQDVEYLVVGGGGSGGGTAGPSGNAGGGGGAGGYRTATGFPVTATSYTITVGDGGTGGTDTNGENGDNSVFSTITAAGGGEGGAPNTAGSAGGSGGGGGMDGPAGAGNTPTTSPAQGFAGGASGAGGASAGGGGASEVGEGAVVTNNPSGAGGDGTANDIVLASTNVTYGGGGGGGKASGYGGTAGAGGAGGGGAGAYGNANGSPGTDNTGGGGGGASNPGPSNVGGDGGSGIVVIRRPTNGGVANMTLESNTITAETAPTKADLVFTYTNGAGTAVLGTNITAEVSMDGGTTFTNFSIAAGDTQGTTGGHTIVTKNNVSLTSTSGTSMRYRIKTLVQSVSLQTRIHAVSLGWS